MRDSDSATPTYFIGSQEAPAFYCLWPLEWTMTFIKPKTPKGLHPPSTPREVSPPPLGTPPICI